VTTFTVVGPLEQVNLVNNGDFEKLDLSTEAGNILGWQAFKLADPSGGSHGQWNTQTGAAARSAAWPVPFPNGDNRAMLDEADLAPADPFFNNFNPPSTYAGSNVLYQDIFIPNTTAALDLSLQLYVNSFAPFTDASQNHRWTIARHDPTSRSASTS